MGKKKVISEEELKDLIIPSQGQILGIVEKFLGDDKLYVRCDDGYLRLCRIRGKIKRRIWIKEGDLVLVEPWEFQKETRGTILWRYPDNHVEWLKKNGYIRSLEV